MAELSTYWYVTIKPDGNERPYVAGYAGTKLECNGNGNDIFI